MTREVELENVRKQFRAATSATALADVSLSVDRGELVVIVGPSGCGKSTMLRIVAGLEDSDVGDVRIAGRSVVDVPPQERDVAMVFQGYALYPQMTVRENIEFPLRMKRVPNAERSSRANDVAKMLRLESLMDRLPLELSGGERQRVAMGRAIVRKPRVFLFDEPLSNLDAALRQELRVEIGLLVRKLEATAIYVTHDHVEAMTLADRICVMDKGRILQVAPPREIYEKPATTFVATFFGSPRMNVLDASVDGERVTCGPFTLSKPALVGSHRVQVGVRPESLRLADNGAEFDVVASEPLGAETHHLLRGYGLEIRACSEGFDHRASGSVVRVAIDEHAVHWFDAESGRRLE